MTTANGAPAADPRAPVWPAFVGFAAVLISVQIIGSVVLGGLFFGELLSGAGIPEEPGELVELFMAFATGKTSLIASAAVSSLTLVGASLLGARLLKPRVGVAERLRLSGGKLGWGRTALAVPGVVAIGWITGPIISALGLDDVGVLHLLQKALQSMGPGALALAVLFIGVSAPIGEELFFRGFMQTVLAKRWSRIGAIAATAGAFGVLHMDPVQGVYAFLVGLYLGWLTEATGSIRAAIVGHAVNNCLSVVLSRLGAEEAPGAPESLFEKLLFPAVGAIVLGAGAAALWTAKRGAEGESDHSGSGPVTLTV
ncbi:MAG: type II CAAX endopeptidase family protein [Polyangiaceae bacterium]